MTNTFVNFLNKVNIVFLNCYHCLFIYNNFFSDCELPKATNTSALSGAGVMRLFNKVGETVNKITYKMDENEPVIKIYYLNKYL